MNRPFVIEAWVLLPDHLHCLWRLPSGDADYSTRWRLIKRFVTKKRDRGWELPAPSESHKQRSEQTLWQRRFWEHTIRDDEDFRLHCDYIHYNPVKHGLCRAPIDWAYSSFHRFVREGRYELDWGSPIDPSKFSKIGNE